MAGAGKTSCALELAYRHQDSFAAAFWQAPTKEGEFAGGLASLAIALEAQLGRYGFTMTGHIGTAQARRHMAGFPVGARDGRAYRHGGESRVVLTSRIPPARLGPAALVLPVHALSLDEAATLARELPRLRGLLHIDPDPAPPARAAVDVDADRERVRWVLRVVQGHPKLLEPFAGMCAVCRMRASRRIAAWRRENRQIRTVSFRQAVYFPRKSRAASGAATGVSG
jgi:hypothetical protein